MKPMMSDEIARLKVWAEKQQTRRPNEILYQDILRLIATIDEAVKAERSACLNIAINEANYGHGYASVIIEQIRFRSDPAPKANINWAETRHYWQRPENHGNKCSFCGQHLDAVIHMPQVPDRPAQGSTEWWAMTPHWFQGVNPALPCELCKIVAAASIHDPTLRGHDPDPRIDPSVIAKLDPDRGDLKSALEAVKPNLDPANQALIDALIEGEGK